MKTETKIIIICFTLSTLCDIATVIYWHGYLDPVDITLIGFLFSFLGLIGSLGICWIKWGYEEKQKDENEIFGINEEQEYF